MSTTDIDVERQLHERLLAEDPTASIDVVEAYLVPLQNYMQKRHSSIQDKTIIIDAVEDALISYIKNPQSYKPEKSRLFSYLVMSADGDLRNSLKRKSKIYGTEVLIDVENSTFDWNNIRDDKSLINDYEDNAIIKQVLDQFTDPFDKKVLLLLLNGERSTRLCAKELGLLHLPEEQQKKLIKKHKDRITHKLRRTGAHYLE